MDSQDHSKSHTTECLGVHVCHHCGWPFPNPHPSKKLRRSHKKVCGTLEGYKLTDAERQTHLDVSGEDRLSDDEDDHKSCEGEELKCNENVKNSIQGSKPTKSEEVLGSVAVAEFGNTGTCPTIERVVAKGAQNPVGNVDSGIIQEPEHPMQASHLQNPQGLESSVENLKNNEQFQDDTSGSIIFSALASSEKKTEASAVDATEGRHDSPSLILDVKPEESENVIPEITNTQPGYDWTDKAMMHSGKSSKGQQQENSDADGSLPDMVLSHSKPAGVVVCEIDSKSEQMNEFAGVTTDVSTRRTNDSVPVDRLVESKEKKSNFSEPVTIQINSSSNTCSGLMEVVDIERMSTLTNRESDASGQEVDIVYPVDTVDGHNVRAEPNEKVAALSTPTVVPAKSLFDTIIKDCIDHGPETAGSHGEVIKEMEDHPKSLASVEDDSGDVCSTQQVLEEDCQKQGTVSKSTVEERCIVCKTDTSECKVKTSPDDGSNGSEALSDALSSDNTCSHGDQTQMVYSTERQEILPERLIHGTGGAAMVSPADTEVDEASNAYSNSEFPEKVTISPGNRSNGLEAFPDSEIIPEKPRVIPESDADAMVSPALCKADGATHAFSSSDELPEKARNDSANLSGKYVGDGVVEIQNEQETFSTENLQMPDIQAEANLERTLSEESTTDYDKFDVQSESLKEVAVASTTNATDELLILTSETLQASSDVEARKSALNKALGEESTTKDFGEDTFEIKSQSLPDGVDNLLKQLPCAVAVVPPDASVDSISQTDSVEGHWGSVSDGTFPSTRDANEEKAIIATETLDMGIKDKDQRANLETKNGASEGHCSDQNDIFDAPSFMTLVEPGNREIDQQAVSSEIQIVQNTPQPTCSPLQAGWFPSLTHDVKESPGRKKNEEIIAKVSSWSPGKTHTPLKSLLVEANLGSKPKPPNALAHPQTVATPKHEPSAEDNNFPGKASPLLTAPEASTALAVQGNENKEWNSPARLPESKKEKRKARRRWASFVCCSSFDLVPS